MTTLHNPDNLTPDQIPSGHRLLDEDEITGSTRISGLFAFHSDVWFDDYSGNFPQWTYCTTLTRAELRAARGLDTAQEPDHTDELEARTFGNAPNVDDFRKAYS